MYRCLKTNSYSDAEGYQLVAIRPEDRELIRQWRNAQIDVLRQAAAISPQEQETYFLQAIWPLFQQEKPKQLLFSLLFQGNCIGYGGLTLIDWNASRAEVSFLVNPTRAENSDLYQHDFNHFLAFLYQVAFDDLHLHRLVAETYAFREETIKCLLDFGFKREGILREHVFKRNQWTDSVMLGLLEGEGRIKDQNAYPSILMTSISRKMPFIEAVRKAAGKWGKIHLIHGSDSSPDCIGQYGVDRFWHCPPLERTTPEDVVSYCHRHQIAYIIPTRDEDLEFYARHRELFLQEGISTMVSSLETIERCLDKKRFSDDLSAHHFPAIPTFCSLDALSCPSYVVKERRGAGSRLMGLNVSPEKALEQGLKLREPIFQPYIQGKEWSVDLYRSFGGEVKGCVARERNLVLNGESQITTTKYYPALEDLCEKMADHLNLHGHAVFQVMEGEQGDFHVVECNPRFGGASTASIAAGLDSFTWFLVESSGSVLEDYPFIRREGEIRQVRIPTDRILPWSSSSI